MCIRDRNGIPFLFLFFYPLVAYPQQDILVFKKKNKTISTFTRGSYIAFQGKYQEWFTGNITGIKNDSFYIQPMVVHYHLSGTDTTRYNIQFFTTADIYAMPKKGVKVDYSNGRFQINRSAGHVHWYWVKGGWIFRVGALGYAALHVINGLIANNLSLTGSHFGIVAGVFLIGEILHQIYKPVQKLGKKYHVKTIGGIKPASG